MDMCVSLQVNLFIFIFCGDMYYSVDCIPTHTLTVVIYTQFDSLSKRVRACTELSTTGREKKQDVLGFSENKKKKSETDCERERERESVC